MTNRTNHCPLVGLSIVLGNTFATILATALVCVAQQPQLQISSPASGTVFNPGQTISLTVTSPANVSFTSVGVVGEDPFGLSNLATSAPAQFSFTVPTKIASGTYMFTADGTTASGQPVESAPILVDVERPDLPDSLSMSLTSLTFRSPGDAFPLSVFANFSDGNVLDVSRSSYITFASSNASVATVDANGRVTAVGLGDGFISATYTLAANKVQVSIPVTMPQTGGGTSNSSFFISVTPGTQTIIPGNSASFSVSANSFTGFAGSVALNVGGLPTGTTASFSPSLVNISGSSMLTVSTTQSTPAGAYVLTVTGTSGPLNTSVSVWVTIGSTLPSYYTFSVMPASQTLVAGAAATYSVSLSSYGGFNDAVALSVSGLPNGATATFNPTSVSGSGSSTLTVATSTSTLAGKYTLTIIGSSGSLSQTVAVTITIWAHRDVGAVGLAGNTSYANGVFTISAAGPQIYGTADGMHFVYQPMAGDGTIVARVLSVTGMRSGTSAEAGVMIRESLNASSTHGYARYATSTPLVQYMWRGLTGGSTSFVNSGATPLPYWVKMIRSGNTFSAYISPNGTSWTQVGTTQTINMGTIIYVGLAVSSNDSANNSLVTATFDSVSLNSTIWTPPSAPWSDRDVGSVGVPGTAGYANGVFTVSGAGPQIYGTVDGMHFVYQPLSGNGTIVARVVSVSGVRSGTSARAGVMIRETLNANSTHGYSAYCTFDTLTGAPIAEFLRRTSTDGTTSFTNSGAISTPYWVKMVRSGSTFSAYISPNGTTWTQIGASQTISMATNVYIGLAVSSNDSNNNSLVIATLDNVSIN